MGTKTPLAKRHLARLHDLTTTSSICRVALERGLVGPESAVARGAAEDRAVAEEVVGLARERGWTLSEARPYEWRYLDQETSDPRPRLARVLNRDVFELDGIHRETDDDDVASIAAELRAKRREVLADLCADAPELSLPGAK